MFEMSFQRPTDFFKLSPERQWEIDKGLGILDWMGTGLSWEDKDRFNRFYGGKGVPKPEFKKEEIKEKKVKAPSKPKKKK